MFILQKSKKNVNNFTLIFESYDVNIKNIVDVFRKFIQQLNICTKMKIHDNMKKMNVLNIIFFENISQ